MSNDRPTPRQRRRIAGERQGRRPEQGPRSGVPAAPPTQGPPPPSEPRPRKVAPRRSDPGPAREKPSRPAVPGRVLAVLGLAAVLLVGFAAAGPFVDGVGVQDWRTVSQLEDEDSAARTAPAAAERAAVAILSYSHESLEADRDAAARFMTADYRKKYLDTFGLVLENAPKVKAVVEADVRASGVVHAQADRVNVLVFVNQVTTSTTNSGEPQRALNRAVFAMERSGQRWLVDDITTY